MSLLELLYHKHYWSVPHGRRSDNRIIQTCYDCGKERESAIRIGSDGIEPLKPTRGRAAKRDRSAPPYHG